MKLSPARTYGLLVLSAGLQTISFPFAAQLPFWRELLAWVALVPLLAAVLGFTSDQKTLIGAASAWKAGYFCGVLFYLANCYWIYQTMYLYGGLPKMVALLILGLFAAYLGLYHALFAWCLHWVSRCKGQKIALLIAPFLWVAVELARGRVTGFPWDLLGYSQIDNHLLLRLAPWAGVMSISFVVMAGNCWLLGALLERRRSAQVSGSLVWLAVVALVATIGWHSGRRGTDVPQHRAVLLQENLSVGATARMDQPVSLRDELAQFSSLSIASARDGERQVDVVIWPEAPSHLLANDPQFRQAMGDLARQVEAPLVIGSIGVDNNPEKARGYSAYDSAALVSRYGAFQGRYDKIHLVPWGEYVPYKQFFSFAQKLTEGVGDMDPGTARTLFHADGHRFGVFICYESIFGDEVREFVQEGAEVLVNISDDGWYGDSGAPWQHLNMARMRAVENQRWVLRDTNTGETTVIDPEGHYTETARHVRTAYVLPFDFRSEQTFYTRYGDWFAWMCAAVTCTALVLSFARRDALR